MTRRPQQPPPGEGTIMTKTLTNTLAGLLLATAVTVTAALPAAAQTATKTGPYVRLDTGASFGRSFDFRADDMGQTITRKLPSAAIVGGGVGWQFTPALRTDLTLSYRFPKNWNGRDSVQSLTYDGKVSSLRGFANLYLDITGLTDGLGVFKPYVGAGLGFSRNKLADLTVTDTSVIGLATTPTNFDRYSLNGSTRTNFAWQVMAGTGIAVTDAITVDLGYRYLDAGKAKSGVTLTGLGVSTTVSPRTANLRTHELTLGLRYAF
ncbi:porin family protein [Azospirillum griseum]|uniref:Porin family protein n=2 Tax=Azospirillum griseum TaxID=2496639 RepID=A0A3S0IF44_9PROT|nr:porin family protein [Azospirillum griseum]